MNRILIAEDESRVAAFIAKGLQKNNFTTVVAEDGQQALEVVTSETVDLVLLDLGMPIKNGWEVLDELHQRGLKLPVIIITAYDDEQNKVLAIQKGASDYLTKPFQFKELLTKVRSHLWSFASPQLPNS
ncbi:two-component response regulator [Chondrocystis sp. NIES-4102]|nr:two-component response regulator [Chondrocystis sp. NIES-4102]